jgi:hypothetical protein
MDNYPEPVSDPEREGLPEVADDDRTAFDDVDSPREADGPDPAPLPGREPMAVDRYGVTPEEARLGESLDYKLARERVEQVTEPPGPPSQGDDVDLAGDDLDRPDPEGMLVNEPPVEPDHSPVSMYDRPGTVPYAGGPIGRLVEPDEGVHEDREKDAFARDAGSAGGGPTAEELAIHEVVER